MSEPTIRSCYHIAPGLTPTKVRETVRRAVQALRPMTDQFDAIAFCGMSGAVIAPIVALRLNKPLIVVRKPEPTDPDRQLATHSSYTVEGMLNCKSYLIVDDLVCSGATRNYIIKEIRDWQEQYGHAAAEFKGVWQYLYNSWAPAQPA